MCVCGKKISQLTGHRTTTMKKHDKIYIAGHKGLVGSAILRKLKSEGYHNLITRSHDALDLLRQDEVEKFFQAEKPKFVFLAAARVGGIMANSVFPADFIYSNIMIQSNVMQAARLASVKKLLFLGSSCIYPRDCPQPIKEEYLLSGRLEPTNEPYAIAKIAGIRMCQANNRQYGTKFISVMPTNLYGPNDNFDLETSHALPALIRKFHLAKLAALGDWEGIGKDENTFGAIPDEFRVNLINIAKSKRREIPLALWGSGSPLREFLHVDDLTDACVFLMRHYEDDDIINIGTGREISIIDLAEMIKEITGFEGGISFDSSKPDGTQRKLLDVSRLDSMGWKSKVKLREGIEKVYRWYLETSNKQAV